MFDEKRFHIYNSIGFKKHVFVLKKRSSLCTCVRVTKTRFKNFEQVYLAY